MKICPACGAHNSDDRFFCIDCNEKLENKLSETDEQKIRDSVNDKIEDMYNAKDPLYVSKANKIMGIISVIGAICCLILTLIGIFVHHRLSYANIGLIFFLITSIEALFPEVFWTLTQMKLRFWINDPYSAEPSDFYRLSRNTGIIVGIAVGMIMLAMSIF